MLFMIDPNHLQCSEYFKGSSIFPSSREQDRKKTRICRRMPSIERISARLSPESRSDINHTGYAIWLSGTHDVSCCFQAHGTRYFDTQATTCMTAKAYRTIDTLRPSKTLFEYSHKALPKPHEMGRLPTHRLLTTKSLNLNLWRFPCLGESRKWG